MRRSAGITWPTRATSAIGCERAGLRMYALRRRLCVRPSVSNPCRCGPLLHNVAGDWSTSQGDGAQWDVFSLRMEADIMSEIGQGLTRREAVLDLLNDLEERKESWQ